ncbi:MAG: hypothetical protein NTW21_28545 [Verrucomicrobia bacterium]|nr:hypothetical protein [Verrucomicrobiota bacterium]
MKALPQTRVLAVPDHSFFLFQFPKQEELTLVVFLGRFDTAEQDGDTEAAPKFTANCPCYRSGWRLL